MKIDREKIEVTCSNPKCGREFEVMYQEVWNGSRQVRCRYCRTEITFDSNLAYRARSAAQELERSQDKFEKALEDVMSEKLEVTFK